MWTQSNAVSGDQGPTLNLNITDVNRMLNPPLELLVNTESTDSSENSAHVAEFMSTHYTILLVEWTSSPRPSYSLNDTTFTLYSEPTDTVHDISRLIRNIMEYDLRPSFVLQTQLPGQILRVSNSLNLQSFTLLYGLTGMSLDDWEIEEDVLNRRDGNTDNHIYNYGVLSALRMQLLDSVYTYWLSIMDESVQVQ